MHDELHWRGATVVDLSRWQWLNFGAFSLVIVFDGVIRSRSFAVVVLIGVYRYYVGLCSKICYSVVVYSKGMIVIVTALTVL